MWHPKQVTRDCLRCRNFLWEVSDLISATICQSARVSRPNPSHRCNIRRFVTDESASCLSQPQIPLSFALSSEWKALAFHLRRTPPLPETVLHFSSICPGSPYGPILLRDGPCHRHRCLIRSKRCPQRGTRERGAVCAPPGRGRAGIDEPSALVAFSNLTRLAHPVPSCAYFESRVVMRAQLPWKTPTRAPRSAESLYEYVLF